MRDLDCILKDEPYSFAESLRPASAAAIRARGDQRRRRHAMAVAALAIVLMAGGGVAYAGFAHAHGRSGRRLPPVAPPPSLNLPAGVHPPFLVTAVEGQVEVLQAATGKVIAQVPRPAGVSVFEGIASVPGDREFFLAGVALHGSGVRIRFFRLTLSVSGQPGLPTLLPGQPYQAPMAITSDGLVTIPMAASPDGTELAYASVTGFPVVPGSTLPTGTDSVIVQDVATGARRTWTTWPASHTTISSVSLSGTDQVGLVVTMADAAVSNGALQQRAGGALTAFLLLNTAAKGPSLAADSRVVAYGPTGPSSVSPLDPAAVSWVRGGIVSPDGRWVYALITTRRLDSQLAVISAVTGQITRVLLRGAATTDPAVARAGSGAATTAQLDLDGYSLLFPLSLVNAPHRTSGSPYVIGHLAVVNVVTGGITRLPYPLYYGTMAPVPVVQAVW